MPAEVAGRRRPGLELGRGEPRCARPERNGTEGSPRPLPLQLRVPAERKLGPGEVARPRAAVPFSGRRPPRGSAVGLEAGPPLRPRPRPRPAAASCSSEAPTPVELDPRRPQSLPGPAGAGHRRPRICSREAQLQAWGGPVSPRPTLAVCQDRCSGGQGYVPMCVHCWMCARVQAHTRLHREILPSGAVSTWSCGARVTCRGPGQGLAGLRDRKLWLAWSAGSPHWLSLELVAPEDRRGMQSGRGWGRVALGGACWF